MNHSALNDLSDDLDREQYIANVSNTNLMQKQRRLTLSFSELNLGESLSGLTILTQANNAPADERHIDLNMSQTFDKKNLSATR